MASSQIAPTPSRSLSRDESNISMPKSMKTFYQGEPLALGITEILIGIMQIAFGALIIPEYFVTVYYFWTGILFIISGSLSVAAARNPKIPMVKGMLAMDVVSSVAAGIGIVGLTVSVVEPFLRKENTTKGVLAVLLIFNILEFCITISNAAFGCKTICRNNYTETVVVVYQNAPPGDAVTLPAACKDPESP